MAVMKSSKNKLTLKAKVQNICRTGNYTLLVWFGKQSTGLNNSALTNVIANGVQPGVPYQHHVNDTMLEPGERYIYSVSLINTDGAILDGIKIQPIIHMCAICNSFLHMQLY